MGKAVVVGAAGFTGRLTTQELSRLGVPALLVGRSGATVAALAQATGYEHVVVADGAEIRPLLAPGDVVVSMAGPFVDHGYGPLGAALDAGAHYLDSSGEHAFIQRVFAGYDAAARNANALVVPAMAADWVPGNLAGAIALAAAGDEASAIDIRYIVTGTSFVISRGSAQTGARIVQRQVPPFVWRDGRLVAGSHESIRFDYAGESWSGRSVAGTEHFGLPSLCGSLRDIYTYISFPPTALPSGVEVDGPSPEQRAGNRQRIVATVSDRNGDQVVEVTLDGPNSYDYSGRVLAEGAQRLLAGDCHARGVRAPVQAFGFDTLMASSEAAGMFRVPIERSPS
jgi:short subunit dehydrogenase-like uncharacterized protein